MMESPASEPDEHRDDLRKVSYTISIIVLLLIAAGYIYNNIIQAGYGATNNDFKHLYLGAVAISKGLNPYDENVLGILAMRSGLERLNPFVYPPFTGILLWPLASLSFETAVAAWRLCNHGFLLASLFFIVSGLGTQCGKNHCKAVQVMALVLCSAFLVSHPVYRTISAGQLNGILLFLISLAFYAESRNRTYLSGAALALAAMIKVTPGVLILHYLIRRDKKALAGFLIGFILLTVISLVLVDLKTHAGFLPLLRDMGYGSSTWAEHGEAFYSDAYNQAPSALWYRLFTDQSMNRVGTKGWIHSPGLAKILSYATGLGILGITIGASWKAWQNKQKGSCSFALWLFPMILCPSLMWDHYLVLLLPSIALLFTTESIWKSPGSLLTIGIAVAMIAPYFPLDAAFLRQSAWIPMISWKTYGALLLFSLALWSMNNPGHYQESGHHE